MASWSCLRALKNRVVVALTVVATVLGMLAAVPQSAAARPAQHHATQHHSALHSTKDAHAHRQAKHRQAKHRRAQLRRSNAIARKHDQLARQRADALTLNSKGRLVRVSSLGHGTTSTPRPRHVTNPLAEAPTRRDKRIETRIERRAVRALHQAAVARRQAARARHAKRHHAKTHHAKTHHAKTHHAKSQRKVTTAGRNAPNAVHPNSVAGTGSITGEVSDSTTGDPVAGYCGIYANDANGNGYAASNCTDANGTYVIDNLAPGDYTVYFTDDNFDYQPFYYGGTSYDTATPVTVTADQATSGIDAPLEQGATITGTVTDAATGSPIVNACGIAVYSDSTSTGKYDLCTDGSGTYTASGLASGSYYVESSVPGYIDTFYGGPDASSAQLVDASAPDTTSGIDLALSTGNTITGTITDAGTNTPLANDCNTYVEVDDAVTSDRVAEFSGCLGADGSYSISGVPDGRYKIYVYAPNGYENQWYSGQPDFSSADVLDLSGNSTTTADFALVKGGTITGTLTDATTSAPLAGNCNASVWAVNADTGDYFFAEGCTDGSGGYSIAGLPTGQYSVYVSDSTDGYAQTETGPVSVTLGQTTSGVDLALPQGGTIAGTITDAATGNPVDDPNCDVTIYVYAVDDLYDPVAYGGCPSNGAYEIDGLAAGQYKLYVYYGSLGYLAQWYDGAASGDAATPVDVTAGNTATVDIAAEKAGSISGTVTDAATGNPTGGVCVNVFAASDLTYSVADSCTDDTGAYTVGGLATGNYVVEFDDSGSSAHYITQYYNGQSTPQQADLVSVTAGVDTQGIDAAMVQGGWISGTVTDASTGDPVADACVEVYVGAGVDSYPAAMPDLCTDDTGAFESSGLAQGTYSLYAYGTGSEGYVSQWYDGAATSDAATPIDVTAGAQTGGIDFAMVKGATISGTVTGDDSGAGLGDVQVCAFEISTYNGSCAYTAADGSYAVTGLADGSYEVQFGPDSSSDYLGEYYDNQTDEINATPVTVTGGADVSGIDAGLALGGKITGTVTDAQTGDPAMACIDAYDSNGNYTNEGCSGADGTYSVTVPAGTYDLQAASDYTSSSQGWPYLSQTVTGVAVTQGATSSQDFALDRGATISGTVTDAGNGAPLSGICVSAQSDTYGSDSVCTDASGHYTTSGMPAGDYVVEFSNDNGRYITQYWQDADTYDSATPVTLADAQALTGIDAAMVLGGSIAGTVTDQATGAPVSDVCITLEQADGTFAGDGGCTDELGHYVSAAVPGGDYVVSFDDAQGRFASQFYDNATTLADAMTVHVTVGSTTHNIDAKLTRNHVGISGTVTDAATGDPVDGVCAYLYSAATGDYTGQGTCTGADGGYAFSDIPADAYYVAIFDPTGVHQTEWYGQAATIADASPIDLSGGDAQGIDVQLSDVTSVTGTVTDAKTGDPLANVCAYLYNTDGSYAGHGSCTGADGTYTIQGEDAGTYDVAFTDPAGTHLTQWYDNAATQADATHIDVTDGLITSGVDAAITPITSISGRVTDRQTGDPIAGACAYLYDAGGGYAGIGYCTGANGRYTLAGMPAGSYEIAVFDPSAAHITGWYDTGGARSTDRTVDVTDGDIVTGADFALDEPGEITGVVQDATGTPRTDVCVYADNADGSYSGVGACTDGTGHYTLDGLAPGSYKLGYYPPGQASPTVYWYLNAVSEATATAVDVTGGQSTSLSPETVPVAAP